MSNTTSTIPAITEALQACELLAATRLEGFQRPTREQESAAIAAAVDSFKQLDSPEGIVALRHSYDDFRLLAAHLAQFADVREQVRRGAPVVANFIETTAIQWGAHEKRVQSLGRGDVISGEEFDLLLTDVKTTLPLSRVQLVGIRLDTGETFDEERSWDTYYLVHSTKHPVTVRENSLRTFSAKAVTNNANVETLAHVRVYDNRAGSILAVVGEPTNDNFSITNNAENVAAALIKQYSRWGTEVTVVRYQPRFGDAPFADITPNKVTGQSSFANYPADNVAAFTGDPTFFRNPPSAQYTRSAIQRGIDINLSHGPNLA